MTNNIPDKKEFTEKILMDGVLSDLKSLENSKKQNFTSYKLFKSINGNEYLKIFPLNVRDNKRIAEIMETLPTANELQELTVESTEEKVNSAIEEYKRKIIEIQKNINSMVSDKIQIDSKTYIDMDKINLLEYQFIILYLFTIQNNGIKYSTFLDEEKKEKLDLMIPITQEILSDIRESLKIKKDMKVKNKFGEFKVKYNYNIRKLEYNKKETIISGTTITKRDLQTWLTTLEYKLTENTTVIFRPVNIVDYLKLYLDVIELQTRAQVKKINSMSTFLIDMNFKLLSNLIMGVISNGSAIDVSNKPEFKQEIMKAFDILLDDDLIKLMSIIYDSVLRLEIDIEIYKLEKIENGETGESEIKETLIKSDTWYDSGLSFFFNF